MPAEPPTVNKIDRVALARAIAWATRAYSACDVCAEKCGVDRLAGPAGVCGLGVEGRVYKEYLHFGEERRLVPSHTVYLSGCNFRCAFCSDWSQVVEPLAHGVALSPRALAHRIGQRRAEGARNVNFVGGLPDVNVLYLLRVLEQVADDTNVVWNTNLWTTETAIDHLVDLVTTWLVDVKFGNDTCARKLSRSKDYWATTTRLFEHLVGTLCHREGRGVLVRHLLMPGHLECCTKPVLRWLAEHARDTPVNLMTGYLPYRLGTHADTRDRPTAHRMPSAEVAEALRFFQRLGFADAMVDGQDAPECALVAPGSSEPANGR